METSERNAWSKDFDWALGLNCKLLNFFGILPAKEKRDCIPRGLRVPFIMFCILSGFILPEIYALIRVIPNLPLIIDNLATNSSALVTFIKIFFLWSNRLVINKLIEDVKEDYATLLSLKDWTIMRKQAARGRTLTRAGYTIMGVNALGFCATPYLRLEARLITNLTDLAEGRHFPMQSYYPYDFSKTPYFELTYFWQVLAIGCASTCWSGPDTTFGALVFHACGQCRVLNRQARLLVRDVRRLDDFSRRISQFVRAHVRLARMVNDIERSFNSITLTHIACVSIMTCCYAYGFIISIQEGENMPIARTIVLLGTLANLLVHLFVYCIASELLATYSFELSFSIYCSDWYSLPPRYSKQIIPIINRSQYPFILTAGKFFDLSMRTYLMFYRTTAGYISMLLTVGV